MRRSHVFLKVEIEHDERERPEHVGEDICRKLMKLYGVRSAELASVTPAEE